MKVLLISLATFLFTCSPAFADWTQLFLSTYTEKGIDRAVVTALENDITPAQIMGYGLTIEGLEKPELIKALFCAPVQPNMIYDAAETNRLGEETVAKGYQLALAQCAEAMEEQLNVGTDPASQFPAERTEGEGGSHRASPWNFER